MRTSPYRLLHYTRGAGNPRAFTTPLADVDSAMGFLSALRAAILQTHPSLNGARTERTHHLDLHLFEVTDLGNFVYLFWFSRHGSLSQSRLMSRRIPEANLSLSCARCKLRVPLRLVSPFGPVRYEWLYLHSPKDHRNTQAPP